MQETICYNVHDILSFQINQRKHRDPVRDMNLPYSYFETEHIDEPDIILNLGDFVPDNGGCHVVDRKWHIRSNYIYCSEHIGKIRFKTEIIDIESPATIVNVSTNVRKIRQLLLPSVLPQYFVLRSIIDFKLLCKGFVSVHAAATANENGAVVFLGRGGTFKTTLSMDYVRAMQHNFLGDDRVIIVGNRVFSYPLHAKLFEYRVAKMRTEDYSRFDKYKYLIHQTSSHHGSGHIADEADISSVYLITKTNGDGMKAARLARDEVLTKTVNSQKMETISGPVLMGISKGLYDYFTAYSYVFPESKIAHYWDTYGSTLAGYLNADEYYEISLPRTYTEDTFRDFIDLTHNLEKQ